MGSDHYRGYLAGISGMIVSQGALDAKRGGYDKVMTLNVYKVEADTSKPVERRGRKAMDLKSRGSRPGQPGCRS